jgi:hypothetical protein
MKKELLDNELKGLSPLLRDMKRSDDGFRVPESYFEALEDSVFSRIDESGARREPVLEAKKGGKFLRPQIMWAAAALALVLAATWFIHPKHSEETSTPIAIEQEWAEEAEIEAYVLENIRDFEAEQLAALPANELTRSDAKPSPVPENKPKETNPIDDLSEEELELLLKEMSEEELESLLKT